MKKETTVTINFKEPEGFIKKTKKTPKKEIEKAARIMIEYKENQ